MSDISTEAGATHPVQYSMTTGLRRFLFVLCVCFVAYGAVYIWKTSFVIDGERYFCLFDDAMISMRYARNLARGAGLRWNPGEPPVEGFTNPLWVVFMAGLHLLPVSITKISLLVQVASLGLLTANIVMTARLANTVSRGATVAVAVAAAGTAFYFPLITWALQGMEVGALALVSTTAAWLVARRETLEKKEVPWGLYLLLGMATFIRVDAVVFGGVLIGWLILREKTLRRPHFVAGLGILVGCIAVQTLLRRWYFGAWLPNTYYLKMTGYPVLPRIMHGLAMWWEFVWETGLGFFLVCLIPLARMKRYPNTGLVAALLFTQFAYSIYVGGDAWEDFGGANRYISVEIPMLFVLAGLAVIGPMAFLKTRPFFALAAFTAFGVGVIVLPNISRNSGAFDQLLLRRPPLYRGFSRQMVVLERKLSPILTTEAAIAVTCAGVVPYFSDLKSIDMLGKCDARIARLPMHRQEVNGFDWGQDFIPGHLKYDSGYSVGELKPDAILVVSKYRLPENVFPGYRMGGEIAPEDEEVAWAFIYFRNGSPRLRSLPQAR